MSSGYISVGKSQLLSANNYVCFGIEKIFRVTEVLDILRSHIASQIV